MCDKVRKIFRFPYSRFHPTANDVRIENETDAFSASTRAEETEEGERREAEKEKEVEEEVE